MSQEVAEKEITRMRAIIKTLQQLLDKQEQLFK